jgi:hypothetical protein
MLCSPQQAPMGLPPKKNIKLKLNTQRAAIQHSKTFFSASLIKSGEKTLLSSNIAPQVFPAALVNLD